MARKARSTSGDSWLGSTTSRKTVSMDILDVSRFRILTEASGITSRDRRVMVGSVSRLLLPCEQLSLVGD